MVECFMHMKHSAILHYFWNTTKVVAGVLVFLTLFVKNKIVLFSTEDS
jgi:hypothetical protein